MRKHAVYSKILNSGLFEEIGYNEFSPRICPMCDALAGPRHEIKGFIDLASARANDYYEFVVCPDCLYEAHYGERPE